METICFTWEPCKGHHCHLEHEISYASLPKLFYPKFKKKKYFIIILKNVNNVSTSEILKTAHLTQFFDNTISLWYSLPANTNKWILCTKKPGLKASFQDFWCTNINNHQICFEKDDRYIFNSKNSLNTTRISSFKYVFIVFFRKNQMLKNT